MIVGSQLAQRAGLRFPGGRQANLRPGGAPRHHVPEHLASLVAPWLSGPRPSL